MPHTHANSQFSSTVSSSKTPTLRRFEADDDDEEEVGLLVLDADLGDSRDLLGVELLRLVLLPPLPPLLFWCAAGEDGSEWSLMMVIITD